MITGQKIGQNITLDMSLFAYPPCQIAFDMSLLKGGFTQKWKFLTKLSQTQRLYHFAFICSKSVSFSSDINYGQKISLPGPALSPPRTCIITSKELHFHLRDLPYCFQGSAFSPLEPALLLPDLHFNFQVLHYHFQDPHYRFRTCIILPY